MQRSVADVGIGLVADRSIAIKDKAKRSLCCHRCLDTLLMLMFEKLLMHSPDNLIGSRCRNSKANVELSGTLSDSYHAHVQARYGGEQSGQDSPLPSHAFTQDHDGGDIALHRRWREHVML